MKKYRKILVCALIVIFTHNLAADISFKKIKDEKGTILKIETPCYCLSVLPDEGGRIGTLSSAETGRSFTIETGMGYGLCKDIDVREGFPGFSERKYDYKILLQQKDKLILRLSYLVKDGYSKGIEIEKTYTFFNEKPSIKVFIRIINHAEDGRFTFRTHNSLCAGEKIDDNDVWIYQSSSGVKELQHVAGNYFITDSVSDWGGIIDKQTRNGIFIKFDYNSLDKLLFWIGKDASSIEPYYKPVTLENGDAWETTYYVIPTENLLYNSPPTYVDENSIVYSEIKDKNLLLDIQNISKTQKFLVTVSAFGNDNVGLPTVAANTDSRKAIKLSFALPDDLLKSQAIRVNIKAPGQSSGDFVLPLQKGFIIPKPSEKGVNIEKNKTDEKDINPKTKEDDKIKILVVGYKQRYAQYELYRIEEALKQSRLKYQLDICRCMHSEQRPECEYLSKNFPVTVKGFQKYDILIFVDIPAWVFYNDDQENLAQYVKRGGNIIFVGDHARGYKNSLLSDIIPLEFDYSKTISGLRGRLMNDKSSLNQVSFIPSMHPIVNGLPKDSTFKAIVHKSTIKKDSQILAYAGDQPLLAVKNYGKGKVISFPVALSETILPKSSNSPDIFVPFNYWNNNIIKWDYYDELWRQITTWLTHQEPELAVTDLHVPSQYIKTIIPSQVDFSCTLLNTSNTLRKGKISFSLSKNGKVISNEQKDYSIPAAEKAYFKYEKEISGEQGTYEYSLEIKDSNNILLAYRNGAFNASPEKYLTLSIEGDRTNIFGRNSLVEFEAGLCGNTTAEIFDIEATLIDFQCKTLSSLAPAKIKGNETIKCQLPIGNLSEGNYWINVNLKQNGNLKDKLTKPIYIVPPVQDNFFPIVMFDILDSTPEKMAERIKYMAELNINTCPVYTNGIGNLYTSWLWRQTMCLAQQNGMAIIPNNTYLSRMTGFNRSGNMASCYKPQYPQIKENLTSYYKHFGKSPRLFALYTADEPGVLHSTPEEDAVFKEKFGYEIPKDCNNRNFYYGQNFLKESMLAGYDVMNKSQEDFGWKTKQFAVLSPFANLPGTLTDNAYVDIEGIVSKVDYVGVDCYALATREACAYMEVLWGASKSKDNIWLIGSTAVNVSAPPFYPEYMGHQVYQGLSHGAKGLGFWIWQEQHRSFCDEDPLRPIMAKKAFGEATQIGPLFIKLRKTRAKVAMLQSLTSVGLSGKRGYWELINNYPPLESAFGHVDIIQESQVENGNILKDYHILFLNDASYLPDNVAEKIKEWLKLGNILIATPQSGLFNQERQKSGFCADVFSCNYGKQVNLPVKELSVNPLKGYELLPENAKGIYFYKNDKTAASIYNYGKGKAILLGFDLQNTPPQTLIALTEGYNTLVCKTDNANTCAHSFYDPTSNSGNKYVIAVNHKLEKRQINISIETDKNYIHAYDLLNGQKIDAIWKDGVLSLSVNLDPLWGKAFVLLEQVPSSLSLDMNKSFSPGDELVYRIELKDGSGSLVNGLLPCSIKIIDSLGRRRDEYAGIRILENGKFQGKFKLAENDPLGDWKIEVNEKISGKNIMDVFSVK